MCGARGPAAARTETAAAVCMFLALPSPPGIQLCTLRFSIAAL